MSDRPFDRVVCVNLDRHADRWKKFNVNMRPAFGALGEIERVSAVDAKVIPSPSWWKQGGGAWGCYRSHLRLIEQCLIDGTKSILLLEDDAVALDDFETHFTKFMANVPNDWECIYLGGQHLHADAKPPVRVADGVYVPYNVNRTHAFALRGNGLRWAYKHLSEARDWHDGHHLDHHLGRLHMRRDHPVYAPDRFMIGQDEGQSGISGRNFPRRYWPRASSYDGLNRPFTMVLGVHRSGSSCLAMMLHKLGVSMGSKFIGAEMQHGGSGEAEGLARLCETAMPFPSARVKGWRYGHVAKIVQWIKSKDIEAGGKRLIGGKYPHLCEFAGEIETALGRDDLRIVVADRPIEESIESLQRREAKSGKKRKVSPDACEAIQCHLYAKREEFLQSTKCKVLRVDYSELLDSPREHAQRLARFAEIKPSAKTIEIASAHARAEFRTVKGP